MTVDAGKVQEALPFFKTASEGNPSLGYLLINIR